ncbi:MAG: hypothetical protein RJA76_230 [Bacteroidota bacterium]
MNKILCIRLGYLGDVLMCSPVLRSLKNKFPHAEIHFLSGESAQELQESQPHIDHWHFYQNSVRAIAAKLWKENFDLIIDFQDSFTSRMIRFLLFKKSIRISSFEKNISNASHLVQHYFQQLEKLSLPSDDLGLDWKQPKTDLEIFKLPSHYKVYALGARRVTRVISYPKMIELVDRLPGKLVLLGDSWDENFGDRLEILFPEKVINLCAKTTIMESAAIMQGAQKVITHNSLMMHIAAALEKQPIVLYTNTSPNDGFAPYKAQFSAIELENLACKPCINLEKDVCPLYHFDCGMKINLDYLFE